MKNQKKSLLQMLLVGLFIIIVLFLTLDNYNLKKDSLSYKRTSIQMSKGLLSNFREILALEKEILETDDSVERERLEVAHRHVYISLFEYRNSFKAMIFYKTDIFQEFNDLDLKISKSMRDFDQATNDEDKLSAYNQLDELLKRLAEFTDNMWDMLSIKEEII